MNVKHNHRHPQNNESSFISRFSLLTIPFFVGLPGFYSKLWLHNQETGDSSGFYEWDTVKDAENYKNSFAAQFMTRCSDPSSVSFEVIETQSSLDYIATYHDKGY